MELIDCPEIVDGDRCNAPAEIRRRDVFESTDGPVEHIGTLCLNKHVLFMPAEMVERADETR